MGVTYLAAETGGPEGRTNDNSARFPERVWLQHWSSSAASRAYAKRASGLDLKEAITLASLGGEILTATLNIKDKIAVTARARVGTRKLSTAAGFSVYYARRQAQSGKCEVAKLEIPWVSDAFEAEEAEVHFSFSDQEAAPAFATNGPQVLAALTLRRITLVPYIASSTLE